MARDSIREAFLLRSGGKRYPLRPIKKALARKCTPALVIRDDATARFAAAKAAAKALACGFWLSY
jgi:hypothetical protein